ncbi:Piso0_003649 [Millerozyma farinosa CBS 7064]|uniref:E3 ubiquitin-protein ligase listerin n=1 Tax=Pichia sorbitophila (strain ATCC MYA-4447 / BCRC 22081 / CBS 7064 / NBRC 10061 / NRRL Y-12695) TaxID=559304 RepID=G8YJN5_PICSO|nr:Piso0_003649 [Millerozyma farinosa CBS 7064]CCE81295.1 Piso0_003649 [Millerozyma farinosa CBS 7064]
MFSSSTSLAGSDSQESSKQDLGFNGFPVSLNYFTAIPDPSALEDSSIKIIFKSLLKKDTTTKEKSLVELLNVLTSNEDRKEVLGDYVFISCWIQLYAKLSIDNSKNVRILAHQIQFNLLEKLGSKVYGKYLKSGMAIWLSGVFDNDKTVANVSYDLLLKAFGSNTEKVNKIVWTTFYKQILCFINNVVLIENHETLSDSRYVKKDDSIFKYERVLASSIMMLTKVLQLINAGQIDILEDKNSLETIEGILTSEKTWDFFSSSFTTLNIQLFKSYLVLLRTIFDTKDDECSRTATSMKDIKTVYKLVSKNIIRNIKFPSLEKLSRINVYSSVTTLFWDLLVNLTRFSKIAKPIKKSIWEIGGSKSHQRISNYLKAGVIFVDRSCYNTISTFFEQYNSLEQENQTFSFKEKETAASIIDDVLLPCSEYISDKESFHIFYDFSLEIIKGLHSNGDNEAIFSHVVKPLIYSSVDRASVIMKRDPTVLKPFTEFCRNMKFSTNLDFIDVCDDLHSAALKSISAGNDDVDLKLGFKGNTKEILKIYLHVVDNFEQSLSALLEILMAINDKLSTLSNHDKPSFHIGLVEYILSDSTFSDQQLKDPLISLSHNIAKFTAADFIEEPLRIFKSYYSYSKKFGLDLQLDSLAFEYHRALNDYESLYFRFIEIMLQCEGKGFIQKGGYSYIKEKILKLSTPGTLSNEQIHILLSLEDGQITKSLITSFNEQSDIESLIEAFATYNESLSYNVFDDSSLKESIYKILTSCLRNVSSKPPRKFLKSYLSRFPRDISQASFTHLMNTMDIHDFEEMLKFLFSSTDLKEKTYQLIPRADIYSQITKKIGPVNTDILSVSNPWNANVFLFENNDDIKQVSGELLNTALLTYYIYLNMDMSTPREKSQNIFYMGILSEYMHDQMFLSSSFFDSQSLSNFVFELRHNINSAINHVFNDLNTVLEALLNKTSSGDNFMSMSLNIFSNELSSEDNTSRFYSARVLVSILRKLVDTSNSEDAARMSEVPSSFISDTISAGIILASCSSNILELPAFEKAKNRLFSEISGIKAENDILDRGIKYLALGLNFFIQNEENPGKDKLLIPLHRLTMILKSTEAWIEQDFSYGSSFLPVRSLLAEFYLQIISSTSIEAPSIIWDLSHKLCTDNLDYCALIPNSLGLQCHTLKLMSLIYSSEASPYEKKDLDDLGEASIDFMCNQCFKNETAEQTQPVIMRNTLVGRLLKKIEFSTSILIERKEQLLAMLFHSRSTDLCRISLHFLIRILSKQQDDFVIEYQLLKPKDPDALKARIPEDLIAASRKEVNSSVDIDDETKPLFRSLLCFRLIFIYFEHASNQMRVEYTTQLNQSGLLSDFFDYLLANTELTDEKQMKLLHGSAEGDKANSKKYTVPRHELWFNYTSEREEVYFLTHNIYYLLLKYLGFAVQSWFNNVKDLQIKQKIEKFTAKYFSPTLIHLLLEDVNNQKESLTEKNDNMNIKVNYVTNDVKVSFLIDEQNMEMTISIPDIYPLMNITVEGSNRVGVKENRWRAWLLSSQKIISLTSGSIVDAIDLFSRNVKLHFSGFEECAICYSILHQDNSLPSKVCPVCKNKFHSACLYKWFKSSGASTCPLCRSSFNFKKSSGAS